MARHNDDGPVVVSLLPDDVRQQLIEEHDRKKAEEERRKAEERARQDLQDQANRAIVELAAAGCLGAGGAPRSGFTYAGPSHLNAQVLIDEFEREQFSQERTVAISQGGPHDYRGKTAKLGESTTAAMTYEGVLQPTNDMRPVQHPVNVQETTFRREGEIWTLSFAGTTRHVKTSIGMDQIAALLRNPGKAISAMQLAGRHAESSGLSPLLGMPLTKKRALKALRTRLAEMDAELAALPKNDWPRRGVLEEEKKQLTDYLRKVQALGGRIREVGGAADCARKAVTMTIKRAITGISRQHPDLGQHLKTSIKTGTELVYLPAAAPDWHF